MKYTLALLLIARTACAGGGHAHGGDGGHADHGPAKSEETVLPIVETGDYRMNLNYYVQADKFGDKKLHFESTLSIADEAFDFATG